MYTVKLSNTNLGSGEQRLYPDNYGELLHVFDGHIPPRKSINICIQ